MEKLFNFVQANFKTTIIALLVLCALLQIRSCSRGNKIERMEKKITYVQDSCKHVTDSVNNILFAKQLEIEQLTKDTAACKTTVRYLESLNMAQANKKVEVTNNNKTTVVAQKSNE